MKHNCTKIVDFYFTMYKQIYDKLICMLYTSIRLKKIRLCNDYKTALD